MKLYTAKVRLNGSRDNEVIKHHLTAAEILLLQNIHVSPQGHPSVVDIVHTANVNRSDSKERARLADLYTKGELVEDRGTKMINGLFGIGTALPQDYVEPEPVIVETYDDSTEVEEITGIEPIVQTKLAAPKPVADVTDMID